MLALPDLAKVLQRPKARKKAKRTKRAQEEPYWSINRLFGRSEAGQDLREVSVEPDAERKGPRSETQQPKSGSLRDGGSLRNHRLVSPGARSDADLDGTSTSADVYDVMSNAQRSSCYSDRRRWQAEEDDPSRDCTVHLQYVPFWALLGLAIMVAGCAVFSIASLSAGKALKQLVTLVGGSSSGFNGVIAAYVTTFTVTIVVSAICLGLAFAMYGMRTDQKLRRDLRYGVSERSLGVYKVYYWLTTLLFLAMFIMAAWFVCLVAVNTTAANSMGTLINGADAGVAIITSAVAAANATLIRAHQVVGQVDTMASEWAQSPVGSIIGQLNGGNNILNPYVNGNVNASSVAQQLVTGATAAGQLASGSGGDQKAAATTLISTAQRIASQLSPNTPTPTPASTPQANFLNLPNINLQGILGGLPGSNSGGNAPNAPAGPTNPLASLAHNFQQLEQSPSVPAETPAAPVGGGSAPPPQTLGTFAQQVLNALVPNEESILKLAGMAGNGATAGGTSRVPGQGSGADGWQFGSGHQDNSVCPSLACLDVKMYNFLNSEACICTVADLHAIRNYASDAQGHLKTALIGVVLLYLGAAVLAVRLASECTTIHFERHLIWGAKFDRLHERKLLRLQQEEEAELVAQRERELELQEAELVAQQKRELELQEMGKKKLERQTTDIRVEVPGPRDQVAPRAPKTSPVLTPGKASPKKPADAAI